MRKIESGSMRMSKPLGVVTPLFKPSIPLFYGGCTVLSIQPSTSILSEKALAALKYAFLQNQKVGIAGVKVDTLKPPCVSDLQKAEAAYSIASRLVEWSEKFVVVDESQIKQDDCACLETKDDHKMNDKAAGYGIDSKDDNLRTKMFGDIKDCEIKDPEIKIEMADEFKELEARSKLNSLDANFDLIPVKSETEPASDIGSSAAYAGMDNETGVSFDFLKDPDCDAFDFFRSDIDFGGINVVSVASIEPMDFTPIDSSFPVPTIPSAYSKMDADLELPSPITSPNSPLLFSPIQTPHSPGFPDS